MPKRQKHCTALLLCAETRESEPEEVLGFRKKHPIDKLGWSPVYKNQLEVESA